MNRFIATKLTSALLLIISILVVGCLPVHVPDLPEGWTKIMWGSNTKCAHGDPYAFWVRPGTENKLVIFFQGGGFCWNGVSCLPKSPAYDHCVECDTNSTHCKECDDDSPGLINGIFDFDNESNPFSSYHFVIIPYCTADFHWGNNIGNYWHNGERYIINHQGYVNASSALEWVYAHYSVPESVLVAGCSGGSLGSILHAPYIIDKYPKSKVSQLGDSGAIFFPSLDFDRKIGALQNFPDWAIGADGISSPGFDLSNFYIAVANHYPKHTFAQFNYANDSTQIRYYKFIEGADADTDTLIPDSIDKIHAGATENFSSFTVQGTGHCILPRDQFLDIERSELRDWVFELAETGQAPNAEINNSDMSMDK